MLNDFFKNNFFNSLQITNGLSCQNSGNSLKNVQETEKIWIRISNFLKKRGERMRMLWKGEKGREGINEMQYTGEYSAYYRLKKLN